MQITRRRRRPIGIALGLAGALLLLALAVFFIAPAVRNDWIYVLSEGALVVAFVAFGSSGAVGSLGRLAFAAGAVGWLLVATTRVLSTMPGILGTVGLALALIGSLIGGVVVFALHTLRRSARLAVLVTLLLAALYLLNIVVIVLPTALTAPLAAVFGLGLVLSGVLVGRGR